MGKKRDKKPKPVTVGYTRAWVPGTAAPEPGPELVRLLEKQIDVADKAASALEATTWNVRVETATHHTPEKLAAQLESELGKERDKKPQPETVVVGYTTTYVDGPMVAGWDLRWVPGPDSELLGLLKKLANGAAENPDPELRRCIHRMNQKYPSLGLVRQCFRIYADGHRCQSNAIRGCILCRVHGHHSADGKHWLNPSLDEE